MGNKVSFRDFEIRDVDFIYKAKNDKRVNETIVGDFSNFSYDDAIQWVEGCMKKNENYKYWAICTNDEFQNIVGWCGISEIDDKHKMAAFKTITIYNPEYRDSITWYSSWMHVLDYVFRKLCFNRLYSAVLTSHKFHMHIFDLFPKCYEGILKRLYLKDGVYEDLALIGIYRDDYESLLHHGVLEYDSVLNSLKENLIDKRIVFNNMDDFIARFCQEINIDNSVTITPDTKFRDLEEWSSLLAVTMVAIAEGGLCRKFDMNDLNRCDTIRDFYEMISEC